MLRFRFFRKKSGKAATGYLRVFLWALVIALFVRHLFLEAYRIPSDSMVPTIMPGDYIFVNKSAYGVTVPLTNRYLIRWRQPKRGDVVVFRHQESSRRYIKRVYGLPGDSMRYENGRWVINGTELNYSSSQPYDFRDALSTSEMKGRIHQLRLDQQLFSVFEGYRIFPQKTKPWWHEAFSVPADKLFVLGDNLNGSVDSRQLGFIPIASVKGRALVVMLSWDELQGSLRLDRSVRWVH